MDKGSILLIENDRSMRDYLCMILQEEDYTVYCLPNKKEGMKFFRRRPTDLVISDINISEKIGFEVFWELQIEYPEVPIIAISRVSDNDLPIDSSKLGVYAIFPWSFSISELLSTVETSIQNKNEKVLRYKIHKMMQPAGNV